MTESAYRRAKGDHHVGDGDRLAPLPKIGQRRWPLPLPARRGLRVRTRPRCAQPLTSLAVSGLHR